MNRIVAGAFLCLCAGHARGQSCTYRLTVQVVETHNNSPVEAPILVLEPGHHVLQAIGEGFLADSLCAGRYTLQAEAVGYLPQTDTIMVKGDATYKMRVLAQNHQLVNVQVTAARTATVQQTREQLGAKALAEGSGKNLGDMLQAVNGVTTLNNGATVAKPVIHGLHSNRILMLNNGIRQEDQQWGSEHAPDIDPFLANNITVIKGAAGVRYGTDAIGGVVLVEPAPLTRDTGWHGELSLAGFSNNRMGVASAMAEHAVARLPGLAFRIQGTLKQGGNYHIPGAWVANTGLKEADYSAAAAYYRLHYGADLFYSHFETDLGLYRGSHTGNYNDLMNAINSPEPLIPAGFTYRIGRPRQHVLHDLAKAKVYLDSRAGVWNIVYGYQHNFRQEYDVVRIDNGQAQLNLTLNTQTLNVNLDHKPIRGVQGQVGADAVYQDNFYQNGDRIFIPAYTTYGGAAYVIEHYQHRDWNVEAGLRYDYRHYGLENPEGNSQQLVHYNFDYRNFSGTLGFHQHLTDNWDWSATLANAWRAPQANELFSAGLHQGAARIELGNKYLAPEKSHGLNLETRYSKRKWSADVAAYSQLIDDYIYLEPSGQLLTIRGYYKVFSYTQANAWFNGIDANVHYQWSSHLQTSLKYAMVRARNRDRDDWLILIPADRFTFSTRYTCTISPRVQEAYVSLDPHYVWQQTRIPSNFDAIDYPRPPAGYFLLDGSVGANLLVGKQPLYTSIAITNALNTRYRDYLDVFRYFLNQQGINVALRVRMPLIFSQQTKTTTTNEKDYY
ncbi:MAG: TonB-dependent receptor [Chitinophagia bacterium]|nr:TonB-dependent receptor [Chitinophagia bacterium]